MSTREEEAAGGAPETFRRPPTTPSDAPTGLDVRRLTALAQEAWLRLPALFPETAALPGKAMPGAGALRPARAGSPSPLPGVPAPTENGHAPSPGAARESGAAPLAPRQGARLPWEAEERLWRAPLDAAQAPPHEAADAEGALAGRLAEELMEHLRARGDEGWASRGPAGASATALAPPGTRDGLPTTEGDLRRLLEGLEPDAPVREPDARGLQPRAESSTPFLVPAVARASAPAEPFDVATIRRDFPALQQEVHGRPLVWMDNAATTHKPQAVIDTLARFYARDYSNIHRGAHTLASRATDAYEGAREKVRRFLGAGSAEEIVFVRGTTEAINLVAFTYGRQFLQPGDEIVLTTLEHHANIVPWQILARERGLVLRAAPITERGEVDLEGYERLLGPRTRVVAFAHVSNALGTVLPVREMTETAHRHGAVVLVDGAQAVPHIRADVQQLDADFYVFSGHKVFGPAGVGVLYGRRALLEAMAPWQGGGNMIDHVTFERTTYARPPARFEAGTPSIADAVGLGAALDYVERLGLETIARYEHDLLAYATARLGEVPGLRPIGTAPDKVSVLSFVLEGARTEDVGRYLDTQGIAVRAGHHCAQPTMERYGVTATVRPSLAFYNTCEEVDRLVEALQRYPRP